MNFSGFDLRLLVVFDVLMQEQNVTRAAKRLGLTQSAASNALNRLRHHLHDPLFLKGSKGMEPTARAIELAGPISQALRQLEIVLDPPVFPPGNTEWTFNLAISDHISIVTLPHLAERMQSAAPGLDLRVTPKTLQTLPAKLDAGEVDLALGYNPDLPSRFKSEPLFDDTYVCLMREDHPLAEQPLTLQTFADAKHLLVRPAGESTSLVDQLLAKHKIRRRVAMTVNQLLSAFFLVENSDMVTTAFRSTAEYCLTKASFRVIMRPLPLDPVPITMVWHAGTTDHPAHKWMRAQLVDLCRKL